MNRVSHSAERLAAALPPESVVPAHGVSLAEAFRVWVRVALLSFGGPAGQIAVMHRIVVDERRWVSETRFLHALNYCHLLPGPEAQQLAIYIGWLMHRTLGGLIAGALFVVPGVIALMVLSWIYVIWGDVGVIAGLFFGLKAAVLAVVIEAVLRVGRRALKSRLAVFIAAAAFAALFFFAIPFPFVVLAAAAIGFIADRLGYAMGGSAPHGKHEDDLLGEAIPSHAEPSFARAIAVVSVWLPLWLGPVVVLLAILGRDNVFTQLGVFFSEVAVVSFGGAYAVLAYVAQQAVYAYRWLQPGEMLAGLGMAETTPGPLIMVVQYVGFLAGYRAPGALSPLLAGTLAGLLVTWVTFTPCFLWVFLGAPYVEALRGARPQRRVVRRHRVGRRGYFESCCLVRSARGLLPDRATKRIWIGAGRARSVEPRPVRDDLGDRGRARAVPVQGRRDPDTARLLDRRSRIPACLRRRSMTPAPRKTSARLLGKERCYASPIRHGARRLPAHSRPGARSQHGLEQGRSGARQNWCGSARGRAQIRAATQ